MNLIKMYVMNFFPLYYMLYTIYPHLSLSFALMLSLTLSLLRSLSLALFLSQHISAMVCCNCVPLFQAEGRLAVHCAGSDRIWVGLHQACVVQ